MLTDVGVVVFVLTIRQNEKPTNGQFVVSDLQTDKLPKLPEMPKLPKPIYQHCQIRHNCQKWLNYPNLPTLPNPPKLTFSMRACGNQSRTVIPGYFVCEGRQGDPSRQVEEGREDALLLIPPQRRVKTRQDASNARQRTSRHFKARQGASRHVTARQNASRRIKARQGASRNVKARQGASSCFASSHFKSLLGHVYSIQVTLGRHNQEPGLVKQRQSPFAFCPSL